ncbi:hypothetical protein N0M98_06730 [Paenibacillus doosanensis]|uniref:hypothetical protein n=1 Tax=Paenibacillus doosanensis TaxID=1229154 RepID=UPI00218074A2|nr:hypothetical protein [Paenibacillus doosanensis]MCS7459833.1 hypothetical protein [Paenibacillus doosanensis]
MEKRKQLKHATQQMSERYKAADTPELELGADLFAVRVKKQLVKDGFTEEEAEKARLKAKLSH